MDKGVNKVRRSIIQRNKMRRLGSKKHVKTNVFPVFPQEEEKHGYYPTFLDKPSENEHKSSFLFNMTIKAIASIILFLGSALLLQSNTDLLSKPKIWATNMLKEEFPFARVNQWYQQTFGKPLAFNPQKDELVTSAGTDALALPVIGNVTEDFQVNGSGIMIAPNEASPVSAWGEGVVIFAGNDNKTNKTVVVQHADNSKSTYALLSSIDVHLYQFVSANQRIGTFNPTETSETLYFSIEKDNSFVDPVQVIEVDDLP